MSDLLDTNALLAAAEVLARAEYAVALTGAGVSKESGVPTYRGEGGLWTRHGQPPMNQYDAFALDPKSWWEQRLADSQRPNELASALATAEPNPGHRALAELEAMGVLRHLITQNVDDLHRRAGQQAITELHGNRHWMRCTTCGARWPRAELIIDPERLPPLCLVPGCDGVVKGDTVMFGEPIPARALLACDRETAAADCFLTIGTSAVVYPAAQYPAQAWRRGVPLIEINPEETPLSEIATAVVRAPSGEALPALVAAVRELRAVRGPGH